jgi:hypothetical protein
VFGAFGHPYLELPPLGGLVTLGILSSLGAVARAVIATRKRSGLIAELASLTL